MAAARAVLIVVVLLGWAVASLPLCWSGRGDGRYGCALQRRVCRILLALLGVRVVVHGRPAPGARLLLANHVSWIDVLALAATEPLSFLAKREVGGWPLIGALARRAGTVFVDRERRRTIPAVNRAMADRLRAGRSLLLFPEGTTTDGTGVGPIRTSHLACLRDRFRAEPALAIAQAQCVTLHYSDPAAAWIGDMTLLPHIWAVLVAPPITVRLAYGPLHRLRPGYDRKALGRTIAAEMAAALAVAPARALSSGGASAPPVDRWEPAGP